MLDYLAELRGGVDRGRPRRARRALRRRPATARSASSRPATARSSASSRRSCTSPSCSSSTSRSPGSTRWCSRASTRCSAEVSAQGRTVFLSSHTLSEVERVAHRVAILREGRLVVVDSLENLRAVAVQRLEIEFADPPPPADDVPGATGRARGDAATGDAHRRLRGLGRRGGQGRCRARGAVRSAARDDDLEEIFLRYYRDARRRMSAAGVHDGAAAAPRRDRLGGVRPGGCRS